MKKLFSLIILCFVLSFSSCFGYAAQYLPSTQLANALSTNTGYITNLAAFYNHACNYFFSQDIYNQVKDTHNIYVMPFFINGNNDTLNYIFYAVPSGYELFFTGANLTSGIIAYNFLTSAASSTGASNLTYYSMTMSYPYLSSPNVGFSFSGLSTLTSDTGYHTVGHFLGASGKVCSPTSSVSDYAQCFYSSTGYMKQKNVSAISYYLEETNTSYVPLITSEDYYNISISRDNLAQVSDGTNNFYSYTNIDFNFSDYFSTNISSNADLYYTIIIDSLEYSFVPITKATDGYSNNRVRLDISNGNGDLLSACNNGLTLVLWYQEQGSSTRSGKTSYKFYINADNISTGTSSSGQDNQYVVTGRDNDLPIVINNVISYDDDLNNAGLNNNSGNIDYSDGDMRSRFSNMFEFFSIAFSWLPSEIIAMVKIGFALAVTFIIFKIIRG